MHGSAVSVIVDSLVAGLHLALNDTVLNELGELTPSHLIEKLAYSSGSSMTIRTLQTLVTMSNASSDWSTSIPTISGALTALARVLLQRSTLVATAPSATEAEDEVEAMVLDDEDENEEARFFSPKKSRAKSPAREVMSEEDVLCLVLVILTASLGSETMIERLAILRQFSPICPAMGSELIYQVSTAGVTVPNLACSPANAPRPTYLLHTLSKHTPIIRIAKQYVLPPHLKTPHHH